jgi:hypothetical protein
MLRWRLQPSLYFTVTIRKPIHSAETSYSPLDLWVYEQGDEIYSASGDKFGCHVCCHFSCHSQSSHPCSPTAALLAFNFPEKSTKGRRCFECCNPRAWYWVHRFEIWSIQRNREQGRGGFMPSCCVFLPSRWSYPPSHFSRIWRNTRQAASRNRMRAQTYYKYALDYHMWHSITRDTNAMSVPACSVCASLHLPHSRHLRLISSCKGLEV